MAEGLVAVPESAGRDREVPSESRRDRRRVGCLRKVRGFSGGRIGGSKISRLPINVGQALEHTCTRSVGQIEGQDGLESRSRIERRARPDPIGFNREAARAASTGW